MCITVTNDWLVQVQNYLLSLRKMVSFERQIFKKRESSEENPGSIAEVQKDEERLEGQNFPNGVR